MKRKQLKQGPTESRIHAWLASLPAGKGVILGPGDDAALVRTGKGALVLKADQVVEGVHYRPGRTPPGLIGRKALARALSDFGAMGARPRYALASLACPRGRGQSWIRGILAGIRSLGKRFGVSLVGGDLSTVAGPSVLSLSLAGFLEGRKPMLRSGARPGNKIIVTGSLGGSLQKKHLHFSPRVEEGIRLSSKFGVRVAMDLSDGLAIDLARMCKASRVGARIQSAWIPISPHARKGGKSPLIHALEDGEDYELLCATSSRTATRILSDARLKKIGVHIIGEFVAGRALTLVDPDGHSRRLSPGGYEHSWD